jgi:DNA modification methylase
VSTEALRPDFRSDSFHQLKKIKPLNSGLLSIVDESDVWFENAYLNTSSFLLKNSWKNLKRNWGHSLHGMASRSGSFPAGLANYFIENFSQEKGLVLDPFSGKGTTALQACLTKRKGIGIDIAPEAYALTAAKTLVLDYQKAIKFLDEVDFFADSKAEYKLVPEEVKIFYHKKTLNQILNFRRALKQDTSDYAKYWTGVLIGILHGSSELSLSVPCSHSFSMSPTYVKNYSKKHGLKKPIRNLKECLIKRSRKLSLNGTCKVQGEAILGSAMDIPERFNSKIDLIVTSPPYFTAQTYAWDNWLREWYLGFDYKEVRGKTLHTSIIEKYSNEILKNLKDSFRVLKSNSWAFVVVGDVIKKSAKSEKLIVTAEIIAKQAEKVGFSVELIINDDIPSSSRYNSSFLKQGQGLKLDRIVCLYKN